MSFLGNEEILRKKVAELLVIRASGHIEDVQRNYPEWELSNSELQKFLSDGVGGVILFGGSVIELKKRCSMLQEWASNPLLLAADVEEGVGQRFQGGTWLVPPMAIARIYFKDPQRAISLAERYGRCVGNEARRCGLNWVLAPICDVNNNPKNPVINVRSWGETPKSVSELVCAFNKGLDSEGVLSCAKHFPGHGDTGVDSHLQLPVLETDISELEDYAFIPFKALINNGVASIMTAHILLNKIDSNYPATLSKNIIKELLRERLNFQSLVVTDALLMKAISNQYGSGEAAVMAIEAGADLLLMPENPYEAIESICQAFQSGRMPIERLEASLNRRRDALSRLKKINPNINYKDNNSTINFIQDEQMKFANELVDLSSEIRLTEDFKLKDIGINLIRVDNIFSSKFLSSSSPAIALPENAGFKTVILHNLGVNIWQENATEPLILSNLGKGPFFLQIFLRGNPFQGNHFFQEPWIAAVEQLQRYKLLNGLVVYGCPYLWSQLNQVLDSSIPAAYSPGQIIEAQEKILSHFFISDFNQPNLDQEKSITFTD